MSADWLQALTDWLSLNPGWLAVAIFLTAFVESLALAGVVVPGVALLFAIAALAGQTAMPLGQALFWAGAGAVTGDGLSFGLGRLFHGKLDRLWPLNRYPGFIAKGERFFRRHGGKSVIIGRFVGPVRPVIPLVAGAFLMPWQRFVAFNLFSAVGWAPVYILPGYLVGSAMASAIEPPPHFYPVLGAGLAILTVVYLLLFRFQLGLGRGGRIYQWVARRMEHYRTTHHFWRLYSSQRPDHAGEFPLPSLMLGLGAMALFIILSQLALGTPLLEDYDRIAMDWLGQLRHPVLDGVFVAITLIGDLAVLYAAAIVAVLVLIFRGYYAAGLHVAGAAVVASFLVWLLKDVSAVPRPDLVSRPPLSGAFPSGHATGITVLCAMLASFLARETRPGQRWQYYLMLSVPILLVSLSRVYLGVHWPTDVIAGILMGLGLVGLTRTSFSRFDNEPITLDVSMVAGVLIWLLFSGSYLVANWSTATAHYAPTAS